MKRDDEKYQAYVQILKEELVPAMGCTEPIALAYAAAKAREVLGAVPDEVKVEASGSIIKNVKKRDRAKYQSFEGNPGGSRGGDHSRTGR